MSLLDRNTNHSQDTLMKAQNIENNLALVGALIVLVGVLFAAEDALGFETADASTTTQTIEDVASKDVASSTKSGAADASAEAAAQAAKSLALENTIDLDIRLVDHTSTLVADKK
jgi:pyruvate/2-oxoglutarate dehydrogenase complex dihydrolipoamide acyltransferase (E2) component